MQIVITPCLSELYHSFQSLAPCSGPHEVCFLCNLYLCRACRPQIIFLTDDLTDVFYKHTVTSCQQLINKRRSASFFALLFFFFHISQKKNKQTNLLFWKLCLLSCSHQLGLLLPLSLKATVPEGPSSEKREQRISAGRCSP